MRDSEKLNSLSFCRLGRIFGIAYVALPFEIEPMDNKKRHAAAYSEDVVTLSTIAGVRVTDYHDCTADARYASLITEKPFFAALLERMAVRRKDAAATPAVPAGATR